MPNPELVYRSGQCFTLELRKTGEAKMLGLVHFPANANYLSSLGCIYDMAGATLLAKALVFVRARQMDMQASTGWGGFNGELLKMFAEQKIDGSFGLAFLLIGFSLQLLAGGGWKDLDDNFLFAMIAVFVISALFYFSTRKHFTKHLFCAALRTGRVENDPSKQRLSEETIEKLWSDVAHPAG
jgi:hypothetical protein